MDPRDPSRATLHLLCAAAVGRVLVVPRAETTDRLAFDTNTPSRFPLDWRVIAHRRPVAARMRPRSEWVEDDRERTVGPRVGDDDAATTTARRGRRQRRADRLGSPSTGGRRWHRRSRQDRRADGGGAASPSPSPPRSSSPRASRPSAAPPPPHRAVVASCAAALINVAAAAPRGGGGGGATSRRPTRTARAPRCRRSRSPSRRAIFSRDDAARGPTTCTRGAKNVARLTARHGERQDGGQPRAWRCASGPVDLGRRTCGRSSRRKTSRTRRSPTPPRASSSASFAASTRARGRRRRTASFGDAIFATSPRRTRRPAGVRGRRRRGERAQGFGRTTFERIRTGSNGTTPTRRRRCASDGGAETRWGPPGSRSRAKTTPGGVSRRVHRRFLSLRDRRAHRGLRPPGRRPGRGGVRARDDGVPREPPRGHARPAALSEVCARSPRGPRPVRA